MFNQITILGNLSRDIEMKYLQSGTAIASTAIATSHKYTSNGEKREETMFIDLTFIAKSAEIANQYLRKGSKVLIVGRLKLDQWEKDGQKRSKHSVTVETMKMLDSKQDPQQGTQQGYTQQQRQAPVYEYQNASGQTTPPPQRQAEQPQAIDIDINEVPF